MQLTWARVQRRLVRRLVVDALDDVDLTCGCGREASEILRARRKSRGVRGAGRVGPWDSWRVHAPLLGQSVPTSHTAGHVLQSVHVCQSRMP